MDAIILVRVATALLARQQGTGAEARLEQLLGSIDGKVDAILDSPLHQGMSRLNLAASAEPEMRALLLNEAREKFDDAASQPALEPSKRAGAALLVAACLHEAGHPQAAVGAMPRALQLTDSWVDDVSRQAFETTYGSESDPIYLRLDEATRAAEGVVALAQSLGIDVAAMGERGDLRRLRTGRLAVGTGADNTRAAPGPDDCDFLDVEPSKLASVWHRLRPELAEDAVVRWFCKAGSLRLLGTDGYVVAYHPDGLKEGRGVRLRIQYGAISDVDTTTDAASIRLICAGDHGRCVHDLTVNDWIVEDVVGRLRRSVEDAQA